MLKLLCGLLALAASLASFHSLAAPSAAAPLLPVETFTLDNGLKVVLHVDRSDPVAAVVLATHAGSAREVPGRTGLAHLFEHLFFLNSENLGLGGLDRLSARIGGSGADGFTNFDWTVYHQTAPNDALEKLLWAEADKLGYFINTVTAPVVAKEIQVVKNEKRQRFDNKPYGHSLAVFFDALYPKDHPYHWLTIGSMADLDATQLEDVHAFHTRWYTPNNATLVIAGDIDTLQTRQWVEKYFGEIPRGAVAERPAPRPAQLKADRQLSYEDPFAPAPQMLMGWDAPPAFSADSEAVSVMFQLLAGERDSPVNRLLIDQLKLTGKVDGFHNEEPQIATQLGIEVQAFEGVDLDRVKAGIDRAIRQFDQQGVSAASLARVKAMREASIYAELDSVDKKATRLALYDNVLGTPDHLDAQLAALQAVTAADVKRVFRRYVRGRPRVITSFVPKGQLPLAVKGSEKAVVSVETVTAGADKPLDAVTTEAPTAKTPSRFDRSIEPPAGAPPVVRLPTPWSVALANGMTVSGFDDRELPLLRFELAIDGGRLRDDPARPGAANLVAEMLLRGTSTRTRSEYEKALQALGASVQATAGDERLVITGSTLTRNFAATVALVTEALLHPRWDAAELALVKQASLADLQQDAAEPEKLAEQTLSKLLYGVGHPLAWPLQGTPASIDALDMAALKAFHAQNIAPQVSRLRVVGGVDQASVTAALAPLAAGWARTTLPPLPSAVIGNPPASTLRFVDVPGAKQSVLLFALAGPARADPDYFPATVMNYPLGGAPFISRIWNEVREKRGYAYVVRSRFLANRGSGRFTVKAPVRSNATADAAVVIRDLLRDFGGSATDDELALAKTALSKQRALAFETPTNKLGVLAAIGDFGLPADYLAGEEAVLKTMTLADVRRLAARYLDTQHLRLLVVGDAATQVTPLESLGYGPAVLIDKP